MMRREVVKMGRGRVSFDGDDSSGGGVAIAVRCSSCAIYPVTSRSFDDNRGRGSRGGLLDVKRICVLPGTSQALAYIQHS